MFPISLPLHRFVTLFQDRFSFPTLNYIYSPEDSTPSCRSLFSLMRSTRFPPALLPRFNSAPWDFSPKPLGFLPLIGECVFPPPRLSKAITLPGATARVLFLIDLRTGPPVFLMCDIALRDEELVIEIF